MFARVFDKANQRYFKSMIYCGINHGYYRQYVVLNPYADRFELVDYLDKSGGELTPLVEIIRADHDGWVRYENAQLLNFQAYCKKHRKAMDVKFLWGYRDVCENFGFLTAILEDKSVPVSESNICIRDIPDRDAWNYIQTQDDVDSFMKSFAAFHDAVLERIVYEESYGGTGVTATFDNSGWYGIVELCFEGVLAINLRPPKENRSREIYEATLMIQNETVLWADWYMETEDLSHDGSYIKALNLKWRKIS